MSMERWSSMQELPTDIINSPAVHTVKDQEWLIQDLKKENFDLKLRLFMEQKEREKLMNGNNRQAIDLEADLTEALDELEHAMDKENQLTNELNTTRRREKTLATKLKRLERVCQQQEEDIIRLSLELENLKMEMYAKDSGIASPNGPRSRLQNRTSQSNGGGRLSPTSDFTDRYSDRLSAGYPERFWDRYSDRNSDRGSDSGSYVTTPKERKTFFSDRFPDDVSTSDESEFRQRAFAANPSDAERLKRREKLLSRRIKNYQDVHDNDELDNQGRSDNEDGKGHSRNRVGDPNDLPPNGTSGHQERGVDVGPDLLNSTPDRANDGKTKGFLKQRLFGKKPKDSKSKSKSLDALDAIGRVDVKNIHKKNKKYNFWGCVRARESVNEKIRTEYAPVQRPQTTENKTENGANIIRNENKKEAATVDFI